MRTFVPITTLLIAAVAGAQPAPPAAPAAGSSATHEVRDRASGQTMACACRASGQGSMACDQCAPATASPRPSMRVVKRSELTPGEERDAAVWDDAIERIQGDSRVRALLADLEIQIEGRKFEFALTCLSKPDDRRYVNPGLTMPLSRGSAARLIRSAVEQECAGVTAERIPETVWGRCPAQDAHDRAGNQRSANRKIRIAARPDAYPDQWAQLRDTLVWDDFIYRCADEFLIDPMSASYGDGSAAKFRANVTLVCANEPHRSGEFDTGVGEMDAGTFRLYVGKELRRICGISAKTTASRPAR